MSLFDQWLETFQGVLTQPSEFFESEDRRDGFGFPLKFAAVNLVLSGVLSAASVFALGSSSYGIGQVLDIGGSAMLAGATLVVTPILGLIGLLISAGLMHIFVALFGGENGYSESLAVLEYGSAISPISSLLSFIPFAGSLLSLVLSIYGIYIQVKGLDSFQGLSTGRALAAILLPAIIIGAIVFAFMLVVLSASLLAMGA